MAKALWFQDDDTGYLAWLHDNPAGFVLNTYRNPSARYLVLHRASCRTIRVPQTEPGGFTARGYAKVCAGSPGDLLDFILAWTDADGFSKPCGLCQPTGPQ